MKKILMFTLTIFIIIFVAIFAVSAEDLVVASGSAFSCSVPDIRSDFYCNDENVVNIEKCADDVFYRVVKENGTYVMYTFGTGQLCPCLLFGGCRWLWIYKKVY